MGSRRLAADAAAINELRDSLDEDTMSKIHCDDTVVTFTVRAGSKRKVECTFSTGDAYPQGPGLLVATSEHLDLEAINSKLKTSCGLGKALVLLGNRLKVDLDWATEAAPDSDAEMADGEPGAGADEHGMHSDDEGSVEDEAIREWSRRLTAMEAIEEEVVRAEEGAASVGGLDALSQRQIFDPRAAFRRLVNELEEIFKEQDFNLMAETSGPQGLFAWDVSLAGFRPGGRVCC